MHDLITDPPPEGVGEFKLIYAPTDTHKGDIFTKPLAPASFTPAGERLGMRVARLPLPHKKGNPPSGVAIVVSAPDRPEGGEVKPDVVLLLQGDPATPSSASGVSPGDANAGISEGRGLGVFASMSAIATTYLPFSSPGSGQPPPRWQAIWLSLVCPPRRGARL